MPSKRYGSEVEAIVVPEPGEREREALLAALEGAEAGCAETAWQRAALLEATEADEP